MRALIGQKAIFTLSPESSYYYLQLFYKSIRTDFLWVCRCNNYTWNVGGTREELVNHEPLNK